LSLVEPTQSTVDVVVVRDYHELRARAARVILETVRRRPDARISFTTGHTASGVYQLLRDLYRSDQIDLTRSWVISSEEYAGVGIAHPISLFAWLQRELLAPCDVPESAVVRLAGDAAHLTAECARFDARIEELGDLDLVVQSVGANGHFGFNEPGSDRDAATRIARLAPSTRQSNREYWREGAAVPKFGLTMGVRVTLRARHVLLLASGRKKAQALARALDGPISQDSPCSLLRLAPRLTVVADEDAAQETLS